MLTYMLNVNALCVRVGFVFFYRILLLDIDDDDDENGAHWAMQDGQWQSQLSQI